MLRPNKVIFVCKCFVCTYLKYLHVYYFRFLLAAASHNGSYLSSSSDSLLSRSLAVRDDFYGLKSHKVCQTAEETRYEGERCRIASKASIKPGQWLSLHSPLSQFSMLGVTSLSFTPRHWWNDFAIRWSVFFYLFLINCRLQTQNSCSDL